MQFIKKEKREKRTYNWKKSLKYDNKIIYNYTTFNIKTLKKNLFDKLMQYVVFHKVIFTKLYFCPNNVSEWLSQDQPDS